MVDRLFILSKLPIYTGTVNVITEDQSVKDIIRGVKMCHEKYANDYDKIGAYFIGNTAEDTCENIFNFLRKSSFYYQEGVVQTLRSPSAILSTGKTIGIDCKNMALFIGGCLNAINRSGIQNIPFCYRFVSDKLFDPTPNHVFIVAFPKTNDEIWIDPIPEVNYFDQRLTYYYHTDKKFSTMALQMISGKSRGRVAGGLFNFGANKLQSEMTSFINQYATAFMYLFLPTGLNEFHEYGWNLGAAVPGVPQIIKDKQQKALTTMWNWGEPTGLHAETDIINAIRAAIVAKIGMQPETYWSNMLGYTIPLHAAMGSIDPANSPYTQAVSTATNAVFPGAGTAAQGLLSIIDSFVPDLTMTYPPSSFQPALGDWAGTQYEQNFAQTNSSGVAVAAGSSNNMILYIGIGVVALLLLTKK